MSKLTAYVNNNEEWYDEFNKISIEYQDMAFSEYQDAIVLPIKETKPSGRFIQGGIINNNLSLFCDSINVGIDNESFKPYIPDQRIQNISETVVFAGIIYDDIEKFITRSLSRLWYCLKNTQFRIVFLQYENDISVNVNFLRKLFLDDEKIIIIKYPTQFKNVIVPDESVIPSDRKINIEWLEVVSRFNKNNVLYSDSYEKIFLIDSSRKIGKILNSNFLNEFYEKNNYTIVDTKNIDFENLAYTISHSNKIATFLGVNSLLTVFASKHAIIDILIEVPFFIPKKQMVFWKVIPNRLNMVECSNNILPISNKKEVLLYYNTHCFLDYCYDNKFEILVDGNKKIKDYLYEYVKEYTKCFSKEKSLQALSRYTALDFIAHLSYSLKGVPRSELDLPDLDYISVFKNKDKNVNRLRISGQYPQKKEIIYYLYFDGIGWINNYDESILFLKDRYIKAFFIKSDYNISYSAYTPNIGWTSSDSKTNKICGEICSKYPIQRISLRIFDENITISYRVFVDGDGWTQFCSNGQNCGILCVEEVSDKGLFGVHIVIEK